MLPNGVFIHDMKGEWVETHGEVQRVLFTPERIKVLPHRGSPVKTVLGFIQKHDAWLYATIESNTLTAAWFRQHCKSGSSKECALTCPHIEADRSCDFHVMCKIYWGSRDHNNINGIWKKQTHTHTRASVSYLKFVLLLRLLCGELVLRAFDIEWIDWIPNSVYYTLFSMINLWCQLHW